MPTEFLPTPEQWFQDTETGRTFRVVAVDDENESIDIQLDGGDIDSFDFASWRESTLVPVEAPEDATAAFDDMEIDDLGYSDTDRHQPEGLTLDDWLDGRDDD
ncbi:DUF6763 family protein [Methylomagnum ishizawai]|uniref:DUF6763 family protein n=1 Tax=Methylomagnum ishizawai TaxID=1760988 RepID=UPI001C3274E8|nr:DUF6763 family protein [Methylomagnum ishizawai]BBL76736.1 hypothetical protein MishRS11D_38340 [Methylomagnum ishizawai]